MNPSKSAAHFTGLLLSLTGLAFALNTGGALAYYAQHFYLPSSEFADPFGRQDSQAMPVAIKGSGEWARPRMLLVRAEDDGTEGREVEPVEGVGQRVEGPSPAGTPTKVF
uniref:Transmembrane protein n=1 Tax=Globodera pallida TaxID=36090 RepID=A0A183C419_GLOPA